MTMVAPAREGLPPAASRIALWFVTNSTQKTQKVATFGSLKIALQNAACGRSA